MCDLSKYDSYLDKSYVEYSFGRGYFRVVDQLSSADYRIEIQPEITEKDMNKMFPDKK